MTTGAAGAAAAAGTGASGDAGTGNAGAGTGAAGTGGAAAANAPWHGFNADTDKDTVAFIANKGWQSTPDVVKAYQHAAGLIGRDPATLFALPKANDPDSFLAVMDKLGRPASPDKYEFDTPKDMKLDEGYLAWARGAFHKVGLPANVAKALTAEHNAYIKSTLEQQEKDYTLSVEADKKALQAEWRGGFERMMNAAQLAAKALGFDEGLVDAIEKQYGYAKTMKFFANLGQKLGDDSFVSAGDKGLGKFADTMTPEEAKVEWGTMQADPVMKTALLDAQHPRHAEAKAKQAKLFAIMYPE